MLELSSLALVHVTGPTPMPPGAGRRGCKSWPPLIAALASFALCWAGYIAALRQNWVPDYNAPAPAAALRAAAAAAAAAAAMATATNTAGARAAAITRQELPLLPPQPPPPPPLQAEWRGAAPIPCAGCICRALCGVSDGACLEICGERGCLPVPPALQSNTRSARVWVDPTRVYTPPFFNKGVHGV